MVKLDHSRGVPTAWLAVGGAVGRCMICDGLIRAYRSFPCITRLPYHWQELRADFYHCDWMCSPQPLGCAEGAGLKQCAKRGSRFNSSNDGSPTNSALSADKPVPGTVA